MVDLAPSGHVSVRFLRAWEVYKRDPKTGELTPEDWIEFCAPGMAHLATTQEAVKRVSKNEMLWSSLRPYYEQWKNGQAIPENGTPLGAWAGVSQSQAEVLKGSGIRTVEELAELTDGVLRRINLPGMRALVDQAKRFVDTKDAGRFETKLAEKDQQIADLQAKLENLAEMMAQRLDAADAEPRRGPGRPRKEQVAAE